MWHYINVWSPLWLLLSWLHSAQLDLTCEISNLLSWVSCFATYTAVLTEARPDLIKSRLAFLALIVVEARKHGGDGWQAYDSVFRENAAHVPTGDWSRLNASLHAAIFLSQ